MKLSVYGATGFIGRNFINLFPSHKIVKREDRKPLSKEILYFISTVDNYNLYNDTTIDVKTNLSVLCEVLNFCKKEDIVFDKPILFYDTKNQTKSNRNYKIRSHKWPSFPSTSCISFRKKSLLKVLDKIYIDKYNELWFDFRVATYFAVKKKQFNLINEHLTFYRQGSSNYEKKYIKFINLKWWRRRYQAFQFLNFLDKAAYKKNIFSVDFILTNFIYKITSFV